MTHETQNVSPILEAQALLSFPNVGITDRANHLSIWQGGCLELFEVCNSQPLSLFSPLAY